MSLPCPRKDNPYDNESSSSNPTWSKYWVRRLSKEDNLKLKNRPGPPFWEDMPHRNKLVNDHLQEQIVLCLRDKLAWIRRMEKNDSDDLNRVSVDVRKVDFEKISSSFDLRKETVCRYILEYDRYLYIKGHYDRLRDPQISTEDRSNISEDWLQPLSSIKIRKEFYGRISDEVQTILRNAHILQKKVDSEVLLAQCQKKYQELLEKALAASSSSVEKIRSQLTLPTEQSSEVADLKKAVISLSDSIVEYEKFLKHHHFTEDHWTCPLKNLSFVRNHSEFLSSEAVSALFWVDSLCELSTPSNT